MRDRSLTRFPWEHACPLRRVGLLGLHRLSTVTVLAGRAPHPASEGTREAGQRLVDTSGIDRNRVFIGVVHRFEPTQPFNIVRAVRRAAAKRHAPNRHYRYHALHREIEPVLRAHGTPIVGIFSRTPVA